MSALVRAFYVFTSLSLMLVAVALVVYGPVLLVIGMIEGKGTFGENVLNSLGYMILATAVIDLAKYLYDEEVKRGREMRQAAETRRSLTKFITIVIIAVLTDSLVQISVAAKNGPHELIWPAVLVLVGMALLVGLGVFMRLSAATEEKVGLDDEADEAKETATQAGATEEEARNVGVEARRAAVDAAAS